MTRRLQNKIAESSATLPVACVAATILWWLPQRAFTIRYLLGYAVCALTTYVILETVAQNALLRVRSRMISALYLMLMTACGFLHPFSSGHLIQLCMAISIYYLLATYEQPRPEARTLRAYLFLSLGSLLWAPLLVLAPVLLWCQAVFMRSLSWRSLNAALFGLLLPYLLWAAALTAHLSAALLADPAAVPGAFAPGISADSATLAATTFRPLLDHAHTLLATFLIPPPHYPFSILEVSSVPSGRAVNCQLSTVNCQLSTVNLSPTPYLPVLLFAATGTIHYIRKNYDDKIRVRVCHYVYITLQLLVLVWLLLQPVHFPYLFPLLILTTVPSAAHFIALTHTWLTNAWTLLLFLSLLLLAITTYPPAAIL